ncbi:MAG TPA: metallophosphoesterase [Anaeromyxobacteraceae bacterium]|nr:metallophosphoesterase [Anaeromyxobacteraceae bacterium]
MERTLAHVSDLHVGRDAMTDEATGRLVAALVAAGVDEVLVTGDVTHRGRGAELAAFERLFAPLAARLVVVPGNHDRMGDDVGARIMRGARVQVERRPGLHVVRLDSTAPHNRSALDSHGVLARDDVARLEEAIDAASPGSLVVVMLHHHLHRLPGDHLGERLVTWLGRPWAAEVRGGRDVLERLRGRCDLVLHGHRHAASELVLLPRRGRALHVLNAGCSPELGAVRVVRHAGGRFLSEGWLEAAPALRRAASPAAAQPAAA